MEDSRQPTASEIRHGGEYTSVTFDGLSMAEATVTGVLFDECRFVNIDASLATFDDCRFMHCTFEGSRLSGINWTRARWPARGLAASMRFIECDLSYTVLAGLDLRGSAFLGCRLREASFEGADLRDAVFVGSDLERADLRRADLRGANLAGATGYEFDPRDTRMGDTLLSHPDAERLLERLGGIIVPIEDWRDLGGREEDR